MAAYADLPIQKSIYDKLAGDAVLMSMIRGVFDYVPDGNDFPFVTIGESQLSDWDSHTFDGANTQLTIHTWTRAGGRKGCKEIQARIYELLHNGSVPVAGFKTVLIQFRFGDVMKDPDGQTQHGVQSFQILVGGV